MFIEAYFGVQKAQAKPCCIYPSVYKKAHWNKIKSDMDKLNEDVQQAALQGTDVNSLWTIFGKASLNQSVKISL